MKKIIFSAIFAVLVVCGVAFSDYFPDIIVTSPNGIWTDTRAYSTLADAISAIGSNQRDIYIVREESLTSLTVPSNAHLHFAASGSITNSGGLTLQCKDIEAGDHQIFTGSGNIAFGYGSVLRSTWFEDLHAAFDQTYDDYVSLVICSGWSAAVDADCQVGDHVTLKWEGPDNRIVINSGYTLSNIKNIDAGNYQIFGGSGDLDFLDGTELKLSWFNHLRSVLTWVETEDVTIIVSGSNIVDYSDTATSNEFFDFKPEQGSFTLSTGVTLTIYSSYNISANPNQQIFSGSGTITFTSRSVVYPEWWNIDNTSDETEINKAITSLPSTGGIVKVEQTAYSIDGAITMNVNNVELYIPPSVTITLANSSNTDMVDVTGDNCIIHGGGELDGNGGNQGTGEYDGIRITSADGVVIRDMKVTDAKYIGIRGKEASNLTIENNHVVDSQNYSGISCVPTSSGQENIKIINNIVDRVSLGGSLSGHGIVVGYGTGGTDGAIISNNLVYMPTGTGANGQPGINAGYVDGLVIGDNYIEGSSQGITIGYCNYVSMVGNVIYDPSGYGIEAVNGMEVNINGNFIDMNSGGNYAIATGTCSLLTITGNNIQNADGYGITAGGTSDNVVIVGNQITGTSLISIYVYGNGVGTEVVDVVVSSNMVQGRIVFAYAQYFNCIGNQISPGTAEAITLNNANYFTIADNLFKDAKYGLYMSEPGGPQTWNYITIIGNVAAPNTTSEWLRIVIAGGIVWGNDVIVKDNIPPVAQNFFREAVTAVAPALLPNLTSLLDSSSNIISATLGSGNYRGQTKVIIMTNATNSSTVTVANHETSDPEVFTFADVDDTLVLMWTGTEWITVENSGVGT